MILCYHMLLAKNVGSGASDAMILAAVQADKLLLGSFDLCSSCVYGCVLSLALEVWLGLAMLIRGLDYRYSWLP